MDDWLLAQGGSEAYSMVKGEPPTVRIPDTLQNNKAASSVCKIAPGNLALVSKKTNLKAAAIFSVEII